MVDLSKDINLDCDVIVIGAGASGAAVSWKLSQESIRVICLEQGDFVNPESYPANFKSSEIFDIKKWSFSPNERKLKADYPINDNESKIKIANYNAVGGSTIIFSGHYPRFHPSDFKARSFDGIADDWPISYSNLEPYYELNEKIVGVSGLAGDPAYPLIKNLMPPIPLGKMGERLGNGFNNKGWHWWPSYSAISTREIHGRNKCINIGTCNLGCPQSAKSSADVTYWPIALKNGAKIYTNSRVRNILVNSNNFVTGVEYFNYLGEIQILKSRVVILASNGVGTPRILLNSKSINNPDGLANSSGLVGKNLMLHPLGYVEGVDDIDLDSDLGPQGCCLQSQEFFESDESRGFLRGYTIQALRGPSPVEHAKKLLRRKKLKFGEDHLNSFKETFNKIVSLGIIVEDLPEITNRVEIDQILKDSHDIPCPKILYTVSENSKKSLSHGINKCKELFISMGLKDIIAYGPVANSGWHLMGTTKMGQNASDSVVNKNGQSHDIPNLFVADSSIFVTSSSVNPANTLQSLALYVADSVIRELPKFNIEQLRN